MENLNKNIGERIAKLRKESNITQAQLAEKLNISIRHCSSIECGNARLSIEKLIEVADLFQQYIQMFNKIYSAQKNNHSKK